MPHSCECADLSFELFESVFCPLREEPQLFDRDISLFVGAFVYLSTGPSTYLLLDLQIFELEHEEILALLELLL